MKKKRILHVINSFGRGGAEVLLSNTIKLLPEYEHVVVTLAPPRDLLKEIEPYIKSHYCLHALSPKKWLSGTLHLRKIIRSYQPTLVHAHLQTAGLLTRFACPSSIPLFYSLHNPYSVDAFDANRFALPMERITARSYHHLIGVSKLALEDYQKHVHHSGTGDVVYNVVGEAFFNTKANSHYKPGDTLKCVSVGKLKAQKNYIHTLVAFSQLKDLPITLDIYGNGHEERMLKDFVAKHDLKNVRFMGVAQEVDRILPDYDLYLISSNYEGFGIAPLEAMAIGLPVLASNIPVFQEVAGDTIYYFDLARKEALAEKLKDIYDGKLLLPQMADAGKIKARSISHPSVYRQRLIEVYDKYTAIKNHVP